MNSSKVFTVSEINASIRGILESQFLFISVAGEISNLRKPHSGHMYFTLKDEQAQIKAVLFKMQQRYLSEIPTDGRHVICRGRISVYEPRGDYQLIVDAMDFHGAGLLQLQFEKLKKKLAGEGLFSIDRKKKLPEMPSHITLVTSPHGAAVHDFLRIAESRCRQVSISIYPVPVQGDHAAEEIADAIASINRSLATDIIVVCRGGGSLEDLWAFNEEKVARAISASKIPVVSAIGHEIDFTIADLVADLRAPTPSAAAEMIMPDENTLQKHITMLSDKLTRIMKAKLERYQEKTFFQQHKLILLEQRFDNLLIKIDHLALNLEKAVQRIIEQRTSRLTQAMHHLQANSPANQLQLRNQKINELQHRLSMAMKRKLEDSQDTLSHLSGMLDAVSPLSTLARGYSIVKKDTPEQSIVTDYREVEENSRIEVTLNKGYLLCKIEKTGKNRFNKDN